MRLPGTRYQEHGWEQVRKLLGQCSLAALAPAQLRRLCEAGGADEVLPEYVDALAAQLRRAGTRYSTPGNSYGDSVAELALALACELLARPGDWQALAAALAAERARLGDFWERADGAPVLRKKFNDMYAVLRDKVDSDNYQAACGRPCSPNRIYAYRMLDSAYGEIARLFGHWEQHRDQVGAILGRVLDGVPIETRQLDSIGACRPEWILRWSETLARFGGREGPLHTRSKRFDALKGKPDKIGAMLAEIGEYETLSANRDCDWAQDFADCGAWLEDLDRVLGVAPEEPAADDPATPPPATEEEMRLAASVSLPPRFLEMARLAEERSSRTAQLLSAWSLPVRLAVYLKLLGAHDDCYPPGWLDPATGELPTMQQLAALDQVSLPTLRKRRDQAIGRLHAAAVTQGGTIEAEPV
ncbi:hypothetical protein [Pseudoduganella sp. GCM10020061]|uniref:hypothetical protein n=1 Tax=Pseudoduganella sp. GCM10020061 TaxID=3317345 RepID=UPI00363F658B